MNFLLAALTVLRWTVHYYFIGYIEKESRENDLVVDFLV